MAKNLETNYYYHGNTKIQLNKSKAFEAFKIDSNDILPMSKHVDHNTDIASLDNGVFLKKSSDAESLGRTALSEELSQVKELSVFESDDKTPLVLTDEFVVRFKPDVDKQEIDELNKKNKVNILSKNEWAPNSFVLQVTSTDDQAALHMANEYHKNEIVAYAQPNFIRLMKPLYVPNDPDFSKQWALSNTGQTGGIAGEDIHMIDAWDISRGSKDITIAIVDEGVDYTHEDFQTSGKLVGGYSSVGSDKYDPSPNPNDAHGTACAGIAAASGNNRVGISGVAPECRLMGIRIAYGVYFGGSSFWATSDEKIAEGIVKAVEFGADVLSNSWGGGSASQIIIDAIDYAKENGRSGKGCVVCFAAGNDNGPVSFPGTLSNVITVAAVNEYGERKSPSSKDGENWGSSYGPEVDVSAPGVHIYTTDIMNSDGYSYGNYISTFNGTSSATPHVAGVAALILSVNPNLSADDVEYILKHTTDDISPNGRDDYTGYGRVNAYKALQLARQTR